MSTFSQRLAALERAASPGILFDDATMEHIAFTAEHHGLDRGELVARVTDIARQTAGMSPDERLSWVAAETGVTVAEAEAELAASDAAFALWRLERGQT